MDLFFYQFWLNTPYPRSLVELCKLVELITTPKWGGLNLECNAVYPFNSNKPDLKKEHQLKQLSSITAHFSAFPVLTHLTQLTEDGLN